MGNEHSSSPSAAAVAPMLHREDGGAAPSDSDSDARDEPAADAGGSASGRSSPSLAVCYATATVTLRLTRAELNTVRRLYATAVRNRPKKFPGDVIFKNIFAKAPHVRALFAREAERQAAASSSSHRPCPTSDHMERHFERFSTTLAQVLGELEQGDKCAGTLMALGAGHVRLRAGGFEPNLWNIFGESMIQCALEWGERKKRSTRSRHAWSKIILFIIGCMRQGYYDELRKRRRPEGSSSSTLQVGVCRQPAAAGARRQSVDDRGGGRRRSPTNLVTTTALSHNDIARSASPGAAPLAGATLGAVTRNRAATVATAARGDSAAPPCLSSRHTLHPSGGTASPGGNVMRARASSHFVCSSARAEPRACYDIYESHDKRSKSEDTELDVKL